MEHTILEDEALATGDRAGIVASTLCAVHCLLSLVLVGSTGFVSFLENELVETGFFVVAVSIAVVVLGAGYRRHRHVLTLVLGGLGVGLLALSRFGGLAAAELVSVAGACSLVLAHVANLRFTRDSCAAHPHHHRH